MADQSVARLVAGEDEARRIFDLQHAASRQGPAPDARLRRDRLERLRSVVGGNEAAIADAISKDSEFARAPETELLEIVPTVSAIRHARKNVARWMRPERRRVDPLFQPASARVRHEPLGVIGIISPWNYPLQLALSPLVDAIAAGNRAMLKPSELTPAFSELLRRLIAERFDEAEVAVVTGGVEVGQAFAALPLTICSSRLDCRRPQGLPGRGRQPDSRDPGAGRQVAGHNLPDYDLAKAARSVAFGKFVNAGQTCIAPDYVLVPEGKERAFADAVMAQVRRSYPTIAGNDDYSGLISERHRQRLTTAIEAARQAGATVLSHEDEGAGAEGKIGPTVILGAPEGALLLTEEIFGPVLPILPYRSLDRRSPRCRGREAAGALLLQQQGPRPRAGAGRSDFRRATLNGTCSMSPRKSPFGAWERAAPALSRPRRLQALQPRPSGAPDRLRQRVRAAWTALGKMAKGWEAPVQSAIERPRIRISTVSNGCDWRLIG